MSKSKIPRPKIEATKIDMMIRKALKLEWSERNIVWLKRFQAQRLQNRPLTTKQKIILYKMVSRFFQIYTKGDGEKKEIKRKIDAQKKSYLNLKSKKALTLAERFAGIVRRKLESVELDKAYAEKMADPKA